MKRIKQKYLGDWFVHYDSPNPEFTLCGQQHIEEDGDMSVGILTNDAADCPDCLEIEKHVKAN